MTIFTAAEMFLQNKICSHISLFFDPLTLLANDKAPGRSDLLPDYPPNEVTLYEGILGNIAPLNSSDSFSIFLYCAP